MLQHDIILRSPSKATRAPIFLVFSLSMTEPSISEIHYPSSYYCFATWYPYSRQGEREARAALIDVLARRIMHGVVICPW
jgi:hypothetical protein